MADLDASRTAASDVADLPSPDPRIMLDDVRRLVDVESPSRELDALTESARVLAALIAERLGSEARLIDTVNGPIVHWSGGGTPRALIVGHHDTVFPLGTLAERPFSIVDGRAHGPGVFDMKAGIVQAVHALALLADRSGIELLITPDEEVGSRGSRALIEERALACGATLVLEPSGPGGALKTARKGLGTFEVTIHGRAAHAGLEPHKGVNALIEAAHQVLTINTFGDPRCGTTVTPTVAHVGTADNVVPAKATIFVDVRVEDAAEKARVEGAMNGLTPRDAAATIEISGGITRPPMPSSSSEWLFPLAVSVAARMGLPAVTGIAVGGGSDGNFTAALGVPTLDGLGAVGDGLHADHEHIEIDTLAPRSRLLAGLLTDLQRR